MKSKRILKILVEYIPAIILSFSLVYALTTSLNFTFSPFFILLFSFLPFVLFSLIFFNKISVLVTIITASAAVIGLVAYFSAADLWYRVYYDVTVFFIWTNNYINGAQEFASGNAIIILSSIALISGLLAYIFAIRKFKFSLLFIIGSAVFVIQGIMGCFSSPSSLFIFSVIVIYYYIKKIYIKNSQSPNEYIKPGFLVLYVIPFAIIAVLVSFALPKSSEPVHWEWLDRQYDALMEKLHKNSPIDFTIDYFNISKAGFGEGNNVLGGRVRLNKTVVLKVDAKRQLYLRGTIKDIYIGNAWQTTVELKSPFNSDRNPLTEQVSDALAAFTRYNNLSSDLSKYFYKDDVTVTYQNILTKSLFVPAKANNIIIKDKKPKFEFTHSGDFSSNIPLRKNFKYTMTVYTPKYNEASLKAILNSCKPGITYDLLKIQIQNYNRELGFDFITRNQSGTGYTYNDRLTPDILKNMWGLSSLKANFDDLNSIYSQNLQLPQTLPKRVRDLALSITSSCSTNYEKAKAIENYLIKNYTYTLDPPSLKRGSDFVDNFLFKSKEGYCTYFASAMTVLARCCGIPARYVEGYILPASANKSGIYAVTNEYAHAWTEIYFEGFGWVPFEPTPPFYASFYAKQTNVKYSSSMRNNPYYKDYIDQLKRLAAMRGNNTVDDPLTGSSSGITNILSIMGISIIVILSLFGILILSNIIRRKARLLHYLRLNARDGVISFYEYYLKVLSKMGYPIKPGETVYDYSQRLNAETSSIINDIANQPVENNIKVSNVSVKQGANSYFSEITEIFVLARYAEYEITIDDRNRVFDFNSYLFERVRKQMSRLWYFINIYILGRL
ncbi:MAG: transglutaminase-like domain-containing protein [Bacillota bacterium]|nr:transglutaminase-like domain-containing protein [Bacillota bacterium]